MPATQLLAALVAIFAFAATAQATGEGEKQVAADLGFALSGTGKKAHPGVQVGAEAALGLTDSWAGHAEARYALLPGQPAGSPRHLTTVTLGATYSLDVLRWVPFVDLGLGVADLRGASAGSQYLGPQVGLGADYLLSRGWSLAALARFDYLALRLHGPGDSRPWLTTIGLRLGRFF
jgi:hypothetical protein